MQALRPPKGINPHAIDLWFEACKNLTTGRSARIQAMRKYVMLCDSAGLHLFADSNLDVNIAIRNFLGKRRRLYVRYVERSKLWEGVRIRKIYRDAYPTEYGFVIRIEGWVTAPNSRWFAKLNTTPGWRFSLAQDNQQRYVVKLDPGITVYVRNPVIRSPMSWYVGYEIHCPLTPNLKDFTSETILRTLWDAMATTVRPRGTLPQRRI